MMRVSWKRRAMALGMLLVMLVSNACQVEVQPTATPEWGAKAEYPAPRLVERTPAPGAEQPLAEPVRLTFDQPMDRKSVEAAWTITPTVKGKLNWVDDQTVDFTPAEPLARGMRYRVALETAALSTRGKALADRVAFDFATVGYLTVTQVSPAAGAVGVNATTSLLVVFNRPVVPLVGVEDQAKLPSPLTIEPAVAGTGRWVNTSIYVFTPTGGLTPSMDYTVRISGGLTDTTGGVLAEDYVWSFSTIRPAVVKSKPESGYALFPPAGTISVTFNQPMAHESVAQNLFLMVEGVPAEAELSWSGGATAVASETLTIKPVELLPRGAVVQLTIGTGAKSLSGYPLEASYSGRFTVVPEPGLVGSEPANGATGVDPSGSGVRLRFASPMDTKVFTQYLHITPEPEKLRVYWNWEGTEAMLYFYMQPAANYQVVVDAGAPERYGAPLGKPPTVRFTTGDLPAQLELQTTSETMFFNGYQRALLYARVRNVSGLEVALYRVSVDTLAALYSNDSGWVNWTTYGPTRQDLVREWTQPVDVRRNLSALIKVDLEDEAAAVLPPGIYCLRMTAPELKGKELVSYGFIKSRVNLVLKQTEDESLVWATDYATGKPAAGIPVKLFTRSLPYLNVTGVTGADGVYQSATEGEVIAVSSGTPGEDDFAVTLPGWDSGIRPWNFGVSRNYGEDWPFVGALYTDRPVYRPGQTVYFKGIVRSEDDAHYSVPGNIRYVFISVQDPQGKVFYTGTLEMNDWGSVASEFALDSEAPLGMYRIEMRPVFEFESYSPLQSFYFYVAEYRKPEFQVELTTDRPTYINGETITATLAARYYSGGAVAGARVKWEVARNPYGFSYSCPPGSRCPWYDWTDESEVWGDDLESGGDSKIAARGAGKLDAEGKLTFQIPADLGEALSSQQFSIVVEVTDETGQAVGGRSSVLVHQGEFYVGVAPQGYLAPVGKEKRVDILTVGTPEVPGAVVKPAGGVELTVVFMEHQWLNVQRKSDDGKFYWASESRDQAVFTTTATTGADGKATAAFIPAKAGSYRVRVSGRDRLGHQIAASTYLWVWGGDDFVSWKQENNNRITLIADKREYEVGDVAEIMIPSPYSGTVHALMTVERGNILETRVLTLETNSTVVRVPITADLQPNFFVSVVMINGAENSAEGWAGFKMGLINLPVSVADKRLVITLTPDKDMAAGERYAPRQKVTYDISVTDAAGKPVEVELSLRLADLAALALGDDQGPNLLNTFWYRRTLKVSTAAALAVAMEPLNQELAPLAKGGGGGEDEGMVRGDFRDTAYWNATVRTDKDGRAQVTVTLPDNLTTWRLQARAVTEDARVGWQDVDILSTLELLVRPMLPRFLTVGDEVRLATVVRNNSPMTREITARIEAQGLRLQVPAEQSVTLGPAAQAQLFWPAVVLDAAEAVIKTSARSGGVKPLADAREDRLPIYRFSTPEVVATGGRLGENGSRLELIALPERLDETQGELTVRLEGSLTAATWEGLSYLKHYPYECTEQTVSRFLPNLVAYRVLDENYPGRSELKAQLDEQVQIALQRLYATQKADGGWGWWAQDQADTFITTYALQGLVEAKRSGFEVDSQVMERAAGYVQGHLDSVSELDAYWKADRLAYESYVLAEAATYISSCRCSLGILINLYEAREQLSSAGKAWLARALQLFDPNEKTRIDTLLSDLLGEALLSATGAHWESPAPDVWNMTTDIRTTAVVVWALAALQPESELVANGTRWLVAARREGIWRTTQETGWSLLALAAVMESSGEMKGNYQYGVVLNEAMLLNGQMSPETLATSQVVTVAVADLVTGTANQLVIGREKGEGMLYYEASLRTYVPAESIAALNRGLILARRYSALEAPDQPITSAAVGEVVQARLTVVVPEDLYYVLIEDPLPAGCEAVDVSLKTTAALPSEGAVAPATESGWWWSRWYSHSELRDEKVVLFARYLSRGTYEYAYQLRCGVAGEFRVLPVVGAEMYFPDVFGRSGGSLFVVEGEADGGK